MDHIGEHCEGVIGIADDVFIYGKDDEDHDWNLYSFMHVACEHGLVFNREKYQAVKHDSVTLFGTIYDASTREPVPTTTIPRNGYIFLTFHPITLYTHCTTMITAEKLQINMEHNTPGNLK